MQRHASRAQPGQQSNGQATARRGSDNEHRAQRGRAAAATWPANRQTGCLAAAADCLGTFRCRPMGWQAKSASRRGLSPTLDNAEHQQAEGRRKAIVPSMGRRDPEGAGPNCTKREGWVNNKPTSGRQPSAAAKTTHTNQPAQPASQAQAPPNQHRTRTDHRPSPAKQG